MDVTLPTLSHQHTLKADFMAAELFEFTDTTNTPFIHPFLNATAPPIVPDFDANCSNQPAGIEVSDYMTYDEGLFEDSSPPILAPNELAPSVIKCESELKRIKMDVGHRIGFRTKSEMEILDDGFKWRKYGKKYVKNSPNPRNYYRCSSEGCGVKKRVERDREDPQFVITTYEEVHNHISPSSSCCGFGPHHHHHHHHHHHQEAAYATSSWFSFGRGQAPVMVAPNTWTVQSTANSSS